MGDHLRSLILIYPVRDRSQILIIILSKLINFYFPWNHQNTVAFFGYESFRGTVIVKLKQKTESRNLNWESNFQDTNFLILSMYIYYRYIHKICRYLYMHIYVYLYIYTDTHINIIYIYIYIYIYYIYMHILYVLYIFMWI